VHLFGRAVTALARLAHLTRELNDVFAAAETSAAELPTARQRLVAAAAMMDGFLAPRQRAA